MTTPTQGDRADFRAYCRNLTDRQLRAAFEKERAAGRLAYVDDVRIVAAERGINLED